MHPFDSEFAIFTLIMVLSYFGFAPSDVLFSVSNWNNKTKLFPWWLNTTVSSAASSSSVGTIIPDIGQPVYDYAYRYEALDHAQTAFFVSIVVTQIADVLIVKTRRLSLFTGLYKRIICNRVLLVGILEELLLAACLCYIPGLNSVLGARPIKFVHWLWGIPFAILILAYDEFRKFLIRQKHTGIGKCVSKTTYW